MRSERRGKRRWKREGKEVEKSKCWCQNGAPSSPLQDKAVEVVAQHMCTDLSDSFGHSFLSLCGYSMSRRAAQLCYRDAGLGPGDIDVVEVHDCFAPNEVGGAY